MPGHVNAFFSHYCGLCSVGLPSKEALATHMAAHQEPEADPLPCPGCSFTFSTSDELEKHKAISGHSDARFECEKCGEVFKTQVGLSRHTKNPPLSCRADSSHMQARLEAPVTQSSYAVGHVQPADGEMPAAALAHVGTVLLGENVSDHPAHTSTPSNASGVACRDCKRSFRSEALYQRHFLSCKTRDSHLTVPVPNTVVIPSGSTAEPGANTDVKPPRPTTELGSTVTISQNQQKAASQTNSLIRCFHGCSRTFGSAAALDQHQRSAHGDRTELEQPHKASLMILCGIDGCKDGFQSQSALVQHRKDSHILLCDANGCGKPFKSAEELAGHKQQSHVKKSQRSTAKPSVPTKATPAPAAVHPPADLVLLCGIQGCSKSFRSEAGLKQHKTDSHGVGGRGLDVAGKDSWMLSQASRNQLRESGVRPGGITPQTLRGPRHAPSLPATNVPRHFQTLPAAIPPPHIPKSTLVVPAVAPFGRTIGGPDEIAQANDIEGKTKRMLINANIAIQHDGKIVYDGTAWIRIGVGRQQEAVAMLDELVHLRKLNRQGQAKQHVSHPTTFERDFPGDYPSSEFEQLPLPRSGSLGAVVLCCSKVLLDDRNEEVVKIAAVDFLTGRPLLSYLVYTEGAKEKVKDWRPALTGLSGFQDLEHAFVQKFKILKGWVATRAALGRFVDQNTILVGYNLRSDLDALRIRHGRCIDLVKLFEKAADNRPLSKKQLSLETLLRDIADAPNLPKDRFGRDCLQDAFGIREVVLYSIKSKDNFVNYAKKKATEYLRSGGT